MARTTADCLRLSMSGGRSPRWRGSYPYLLSLGGEFWRSV